MTFSLDPKRWVGFSFVKVNSAAKQIFTDFQGCLTTDRVRMARLSSPHLHRRHAHSMRYLRS